MKKAFSILRRALHAALLFAVYPVHRYAQSVLAPGLLAQNYPAVSQWLKHMSVDPTNLEMVPWPLYDFAVYPAAGLTQFKFFQSGIGQGLSSSPGNAGQVKSLEDTNLQGVGGMLPAPQMYWISGIEVLFDAGSSATANTFAAANPATYSATAAAPAAPAADTIAVLTAGSLRLNIATKPYYEDAPLYMMPPSASIQLDSSLGVTLTSPAVVSMSKARAIGLTCKLNPGTGIQFAVNFDVTLGFAAAVPTPSTFNGRIGVRLQGYQIRATQ